MLVTDNIQFANNSVCKSNVLSSSMLKLAYCLLLLSGLLFSSQTLAGTFTVFGPEIIKRIENKPGAIELEFLIENPSLSYEIHVISEKSPVINDKKSSHEKDDDDDDDEKEKKSKSVVPIANIQLNSADIVGPNYFNDTVTEFVNSIALQNTNRISISPDAVPGNNLTVTIVGTATDGQTFTAFGPVKVERGKKDTFTVDYPFEVSDPAADYKVQIQNGALKTKKDKNTRVSVENVSINQSQVIKKKGDKKTIIDSVDPGIILADNIISISLRGKSGSYLSAQVVGYDVVPPDISATIEPMPTSENNSTVKVNFICNDITSGIASCSEPVTVDVTATKQTITGTAVDNAGNSSSATVILELDATTGTIKAAVSNKGTFTVFGPETITRLKGRPDAAELSFPVMDPSLEYEIRVISGRDTKNEKDSDEDDDSDSDDDKSKKDKSTGKQSKESDDDDDKDEKDKDDSKKHTANIIINGENIVGPNYFTSAVTEFTGKVLLLDQNEISIAPEKPSGSYLIVELIRFDSNGQEFSVFGPITVSRDKKEVFTISYGFAVIDPEAKYELLVSNGSPSEHEDNKTRVSSASISINDETILRQKDFKKKIAKYVKPVTLLSNNTIDFSIRGKPGSYLTTEVIGYDNTPPEITATIEPYPNQYGWNNTSVVVTFSCSDLTSGVATCSEPVTLELEGENQKVIGTAVDVAGNQAMTVVTINIDKTAATVNGFIEPAPNQAGWNNEDLIVKYQCDDPLSGVAFCSESVAVTQEGENQEFIGKVIDKAGNEATTTVVVNLDKTDPLISVTPVPASNIRGWHNSAVQLGYTCADTLSGVASCPLTKLSKQRVPINFIPLLHMILLIIQPLQAITLNIDRTIPVNSGQCQSSYPIVPVGITPMPRLVIAAPTH